MTVYEKLQNARAEFLCHDIKKSGKNKFAGYEYFELGDFMPTITRIFDEVGLCGVVRFTTEQATLTVYDTADGSSIEFISPMVFAVSVKGQAIQDLGSTHTYMRRYLWLLAADVTEHDSVDSLAPAEAPKPVKAASKPTTPAEAKPAEEKPAETPETLRFFVDKLIAWGAVQDKESELVGAWKANQTQIDAIKKADPALFEHLRDCFKDLKANLQPKE
jgi:hypothetical protein